MACVVGYEAFRTEIVDHPVCVRLVGPDGRQHRQLSRSLSRVWRRMMKRGREKAVRYVNAFVWTLNVAHAGMPDVAERYVAGVGPCREAQDQFVVGAKIRSDDATERDGSMWLKPRRGEWSRVSDALVAMGLVTEGLVHEQYGGQDPSKVDKAVSRVDRAARKGSRPNPRKRNDVDRRLRLGADPSHAPRYDDPCFWERWEEDGLVATGAPGVFRHIGALGRFAGARAFQTLALTIHDLLVRAAEEGTIPAPNKGSRGERSMILRPLRSRFDAMMAWVAGERAELTGRTLEELRLMAADPRRRDELKAMPLFTEDGVSHIEYDRLYRIFRRAAEWAGLWIEDDEWRDTGRKRYVSFHYNKHEYVHRRLDEVDAMPEAERPAARKAIIAYMGWGRTTGERMLEWYSAHHLVKVAARAALAFNAKTDAELAGRAKQPRGVVVRADVHELLEGLA